MELTALSRAHGAFNVLGGAWPLLHMRSFEAVSGPKTDRWLVRTVAGLLVVNGAVLLSAGPSAEAQRQARVLGLGTAATLAVVDLVHGLSGRISRVYLLDAAAEAGWVAAWLPARAAGRTARR